MSIAAKAEATNLGVVRDCPRYGLITELRMGYPDPSYLGRTLHEERELNIIFRLATRFEAGEDNLTRATQLAFRKVNDAVYGELYEDLHLLEQCLVGCDIDKALEHLGNVWKLIGRE